MWFNVGSVSVTLCSQTEHVFSFSPSVSSVGSLVTFQSPKLCSAFESTSECPHVVACQWEVASLVHSSANSCVWFNAGSISVTLYSQTEHVFSFSPSVSSVGSLVTFQSPKLCSAFESTSECPHVVACQWEVASLVHSSANSCVCCGLDGKSGINGFVQPTNTLVPKKAIKINKNTNKLLNFFIYFSSI